MPPWLIWLIASGAFAAAEALSLTSSWSCSPGERLPERSLRPWAARWPCSSSWPSLPRSPCSAWCGPIAKRHLTLGTGTRTGTDALVGKEAIVLSDVDAHDGRVRLNGGEWSARSFDRAQHLPAGTVVRVMEISGATAVVWQEPQF